MSLYSYIFPLQTRISEPRDFVLYNHVTVHRNKLLFNNQPDAQIIQIYSVILCPSSGVFYCTFGTGRFRAGF